MKYLLSPIKQFLQDINKSINKLLVSKYEINVLVQSGAIVQVLKSFMTICQHESDKIYCMTM